MYVILLFYHGHARGFYTLVFSPMFIPFTLFAGFSLLYHKNTFEKMQFFLEADFPIRFFAIFSANTNSPARGIFSV